jgi:hypothetical protein
MRAILKDISEVDGGQTPTIVSGMYELFDGVTERVLEDELVGDVDRLFPGADTSEWKMLHVEYGGPYYIHPDWIKPDIYEDIDKLFREPL